MKKQTIYQIFAASSLSFQLSKIYIAAFILLFALGAETFAQNGTYTTIDPPNSTSTGIYGINNSGSMSGTYQGSNNDSHVFNLTNGVFTIFDVLGNLQFDDNLGFNASGDIVSTYYDFQINRVVGFRMSNGSITKINPSSLPQNPSSLATQSINESGLIIGTYDTTEVPYRKVFKWINGIITTFSLPWAGDVSAINSSGDFVGTYADANSVRHGYRWTNGSITIIDPPGSVETRAKRLNNAGEVIGTYKDSNSRTHGYIWINGSFIIIDPPGSSYTSYTGPLGINSAGDVTGSYTDTNGRSHGYKWINGVFTIIDPPGTTYTYPRGINDNGDIVGNYGDASFKSHGFKFSNGNTLTATVQTNPVGRNFTVDGTAYSSTQTFTWQQGSTHTISTSSPQTGSGGTQYVWSNWSDGGAISHAVAPTTNATYTANFTTPVPVVTDVIREFPGVFLTGFDKTNNFDVRVDWKGTTGKVRFQVNDGTPFEVAGTTAGAIKAFNLKNDFTSDYTPSIIKITPINGGGVVGETRTEQIYIYSYPTWLTFALNSNPSALSFTTQPGEIRANFNVKFPNPEFKASGYIPDAVPFIGGDLGISKAQGTFNGYASSLGTGTLTLGGETKFKAFGQELSGGLSGTGNFVLNPNTNGLSVSSASLKLDLAGTVSKEENLVNVIPALAPFRRFPVVRAFTDSVKLRGELSPSVVFNTTWKQDPMTRDLVFNEATGTIGISLKAIINARINDHFKFQGWVAGGGKLVIKTPSPYLLSASINFEAGAQLKIDGLFGGQELKAKVNYGCKITTAANAATCESSNSSNLLSGDNYFNPKLKLLRPEYEQFGQYESFKPADNRFDKPNADKTESPIDSMINETIVSNVFGNAEPTILPVGGSGKLLLWVRQNPNLPVLQSTDIVWSYYDGSSWTAPAVITSDTRAEFSPVAGVDANGKVTAAWLKIKTPAFDTPVPTLDDLPVYYKQVEVISAVFDPVTRAWSSETSLTNDSALDTSLRMAKDNSGNLLLTWQSNPSGEFTADSANPATLKYSFRNGSGWNAPAAVAGNLSNISEQAVALKGNNAFIVLPYDPDPNAVNDGKLLIYNWNGGNWSAGSVFAADNVDNVLPAAVYDTSGKGQIIWQKGANLVQANTTNSSPQIVREGSQSAAFHNIRLLNNGRDNLTLTWQEVVDNAPANIFGKFYDPSSNKWGEDRRLNQTDWQSKDVSGYYDARGNLQLVYLATQILRVTETVTINGQNYQIENVPEDGQTDLRLLTVNQAKPIFDFDGDGKSEIGIFRPSAAEWWYQRSIDGATRAVQFGSPNDIRVTPADFTGDGRTDIAFFRPSDGNWFVIRSEDSTYFAFPFGSNGDIPAPADFDGDGKADAAVFRPSQGVWYVNKSSGGTSITQFGIAEDKPVVADYDGDAKADIAIFRPSNNSWWHVRSSDGEFRVYQFALGTDKPVIGDWTGDGKADLATYRPTTGEWFIRKSEDLSYYAVPFGAAGDIPAPGDYDGDGKLDTAVYRPTQRTWYINRSTVGILITQFGIEEDKPLEASFIP